MLAYILLMAIGLRLSFPPIYLVGCGFGMLFKVIAYGMKMYQLGKKSDDAS